MIRGAKHKIKNWIINALLSADEEVKGRIYRSLFSSNLRIEQGKYRKKYDIDPGFAFNGIHTSLYGEGEIKLGKDSYIGDFSTIQSSEGCKVVIGEKCSLSHNIRIYTESNIADQDFSAKDLRSKKGDVIIEDFVWIGANVFINPGIVIGKNSVVGANSVVVKDLPPNGIYGGVPAVLLKNKTGKV